jgi:hypothetical protein
LKVTCFVAALLFTKPIFPLTFAPSVIVLTELFTSNGDHADRQAPLHLRVAPFSTLSRYRVRED